MSGNKSKRKKYHHPAEHEHPKAGDKLGNKPDQVTVSGNVETNFPPNLVEKYDTANEKQEARDYKRFAVEIVTAVLLFVYTTVAIWQGCSNKKAADAAKSAANTAEKSVVWTEKSIKIDQRPWLQVIQDIKTPTPDSPLCPFGATLKVTNTGKTPAMHVVSKTVVRVVPNGIYLDFPYDERIVSWWSWTTGAIFPNEPTPISIRCKITPNDYIIYKRKTAYAVEYSELTYDDIFGDKHWVRRCNPIASKPGIYTFERCTGYNST